MDQLEFYEQFRQHSNMDLIPEFIYGFVQPGGGRLFLAAAYGRIFWG
jgi:hypothetical protein